MCKINKDDITNCLVYIFNVIKLIFKIIFKLFIAVLMIGFTLWILITSAYVLLYVFIPDHEIVNKFDKYFNSHIQNLILPLNTLLTTTVLSIAVLKTTVKSTAIANNMFETEKKRLLSEQIQSSTKIYLSILSSIEYVKKRYTIPNNLRTHFISDTWINDLAMVKNYFSVEEFTFLTDTLRNITALSALENQANYDNILAAYVNYEFNTILLDLEKEADIAFSTVDILNIMQIHTLNKLKRITELSLYNTTASQIEKKLNIIIKLKTVNSYTNSVKIYSPDSQKTKSFIYTLSNYDNKTTMKLIDDNDNKNRIFDITITDSLINGYMKKYKNGTLAEEGFYKNGLLYNGTKYNVYKDTYIDGTSLEKQEQLEQEQLEKWEQENDFNCPPPIVYEEYYKAVIIKNSKPNYDNQSSNIFREYE